MLPVCTGSRVDTTGDSGLADSYLVYVTMLTMNHLRNEKNSDRHLGRCNKGPVSLRLGDVAGATDGAIATLEAAAPWIRPWGGSA